MKRPQVENGLCTEPQMRCAEENALPIRANAYQNITEPKGRPPTEGAKQAAKAPALAGSTSAVGCNVSIALQKYR
jgi:hypothetical protein